MTPLPEEPPQPKDPVAVVATRILAPYLREHGFTRLSPRLFGRAREGIVQWVELTYSNWGSRDFVAHCGTMPMFAPFQVGNINTRDLGHGFGGMVEYATEVVTEAKRKLEMSEMAWLDDLWNPIAFRNLMLEQASQAKYACVYLRTSAELAAAIGDLQGARKDAIAALAENARGIEHSKQVAQQFGYGADFWSGGLHVESYLRRFIAALDEGRHRELLEQGMLKHDARPALRRLPGALELPKERKV